MSKATIILHEIASILWPHGIAEWEHSSCADVVDEVGRTLRDGDFGPEFAAEEPTPSLDCEITEEGVKRFAHTVSERWPIETQVHLMRALLCAWMGDRRPIHEGEDNGQKFFGPQMRGYTLEVAAYFYSASALRDLGPTALDAILAAKTDMRLAIEAGTAMAREHDAMRTHKREE